MRSILAIVAAAALTMGVAACDQGVEEEAEVPVEEELEGTVEPQEQIGEEPLEEEGALEEEPLEEPAETAE